MEIFESDEKVGIDRREHPRLQIPAAVSCTFFEEVLQGKDSFKGFIQDISVGGVSLEIRDDFLTIRESLLLYTNIKWLLNLISPKECSMLISRVSSGGTSG